jgi:hypothetical protein
MPTTDFERVLIAASLFLGEKATTARQKSKRRRILVSALVALGSGGLVFVIGFGLIAKSGHAPVILPVIPLPCDPQQASFCRVQVFFATDRKPSGQSSPAKYFSGERSDDSDPLTFGTLHVSIPARHKTGRIEKPLPFFRPDPTHDVVVMDLEVTPQSQFLSSLTNAVNFSRNKEALVFIHGYHVTFDEAARRTAQLTWDLGFRGIPILYSWPSKGATLMYSADEGSERVQPLAAADEQIVCSQGVSEFLEPLGVGTA